MLQWNASDYEGRIAKTILELWRIYAIIILRMEGMTAFWYEIRKELIVVFWYGGAFFRLWSKSLALTWNNVDFLKSNSSTKYSLCVDFADSIKRGTNCSTEEKLIYSRTTWIQMMINLFTSRRSSSLKFILQHYKIYFPAKKNPTGFGILEGDHHNCALKRITSYPVQMCICKFLLYFQPHSLNAW
jgi:hypothetical protein